MHEPTFRFGYHIIVNVARYAQDNPELRKAYEGPGSTGT